MALIGIKKIIPKKARKAIKALLLKQMFKKGRIGRDREIPKQLYFAVTNICNANCTFCAYRYNETSKQIMPFEIFRKGLDEYVEMGGREINLTPINGEPLVDPNLFEKIIYAKNNRIDMVYFSTNGILLNKNNNYQKIIDSRTDMLQISSPGLNDDAYKRVYRTNRYSDIVDGIVKLLEYKMKTESPIKIGIDFRNDRPYEELLRDEGIKKIEFYIKNGMISIDKNGRTEMDDWCGQVKDSDLTGIMVIKKADEYKHNIPCHRLFTDLSILPNGLVRLCGCRFYKTEIDELVIGDIRRQHLKDMLAGEKFREIIENIFRGCWPLVCKNCSYYSI